MDGQTQRNPAQTRRTRVAKMTTLSSSDYKNSATFVLNFISDGATDGTPVCRPKRHDKYLICEKLLNN